MDDILGSVIEEALLSGDLSSAISDGLSEIVGSMVGILMLILLPATILGVAYCFFGIKIYKIILAITTGLVGGIIGAVIFAATTQSGGGAVLGFILFAAIFGVLAWFIWKVFLFLSTFNFGFLVFFILFLLITKSIPASAAIGIIVGIALAVLVVFYANLIVMITTAIKGASSIAIELSLPFLMAGVGPCIGMYIVFLIAFSVGGFFVQYKFFAGKYSVNVSKKSKETSGNTERAVNTNSSASKIVGIEGMYKGFEFDVDDSLTFGRDPENCNVMFPDTAAGISRIQCQIMYDKRQRKFSIVDKFSSYGTTVNGKKLEINNVTPLNHGDVIMFGENNVFKLE